MNKLIESLKMIERAYQDYLTKSKSDADAATSDNVVSLMPKLEQKKSQSKPQISDEEASN